MSLSQIELVWVRVLCKMGESKMAQVQDGCHHQVVSEWMSLSQIELFWVRDLCKMVECKMAEFQDGHHHQAVSEWMMKFFFVQNGWMQDGRIQDGCHHQVEWEWMSLSQIKLVWFRVRLEWECFWVNLRDDNKVSESMMPCGLNSTWQNSRWLPSSSWVRNEWVKFICAKWLNPSW